MMAESTAEQSTPGAPEYLTERITIRVTKEDREILEGLANYRSAYSGIEGDSISEYLRWLINKDVLDFVREVQERRR